MFVGDNQLKTAKKYFSKRLIALFSSSEINSMWREIICTRFNWSQSDLLLNTDSKVSESDLLFIRSYVHRLIESEPFQYIHEKTIFYGIELKCDKRALIPRPETEELVSWVIESGPFYTIGDLCTGSGCIAIALKSKFTESEITGIDISNDALTLAKENSLLTNHNVQFIQADVLKIKNELPEKKWDCIVSNPPYIPNQEKATMAKNVLDFEPEISLFVDNERPILFYTTISDYAKQNLTKNGLLFFEIHPQFSEEIIQLLDSYGFTNIELRKDLQGKNRMIKAQKA